MSSEALRLADLLESLSKLAIVHSAASLLRTQAARIASLEAERDQLRAEVERLRKDGEQWQAHKEVLKASCLDESLTIRMTMRHKGLTVEREGVLTMLATDRAIAGGDEVSAHMAGRYYNEMRSAIEAAKEAK